MKRALLFFSFFLTASVLCFAQSSPVFIKVTPGVALPLGADSDFFSFGGGGGASGNFSMPFFRPLSLGAEGSYLLAPLSAKDAEGKTVNSLSLISGGAVLGVNFALGDRFLFYAYGDGGFFYTFFNKDEPNGEGNPYVGGGGGAAFRIVPAFSIGVDVSYRNYLGLYNCLNISLGTTIHLGEFSDQPRVRTERPGRPKPLNSNDVDGDGVDFTDVELVNIFPVFFKYYDNNPIGTVTIRNFENKPAEDITISFNVKQYMDNPKEMKLTESLAPGEEKKIELYGLFTNDVLEITEGTKVSALLNVSCTINGKEYSSEAIETIRLNNRNAVTWDDDRKAGAFVTAKDPAVLKFTKNVVGWTSEETSQSLNKNFQIAMALHEALDLYGVSYVIDPTTPYLEMSEDKLAVDYLQFPRQTLEFLSGDCDDLSILYASLLEAAGIPTAFITIPGHIFMAFDLGITPEEARARFRQSDELIFKDGSAWIPVEITERRTGFLSAWETAAKEWRENNAKGQSGFFEMHKAWELYEPVGFPGTISLQLPSRNDIVTAFRNEKETFVETEMAPQLARIQGRINQEQGGIKWINKLGILYAQYGMVDEAMAEFRKVLAQRAYLPTLVNIGNLHYMKGEMLEAKRYYNQALTASPDNPMVILASARVDHALENYGSARRSYARLQELAPDLAERFSYLDLRGEEAARAADALRVRDIILWNEEEE